MTEELRAAAERLIGWVETAGGCGNPYRNRSVKDLPKDVAKVADACLAQDKILAAMRLALKKAMVVVNDPDNDMYCHCSQIDGQRLTCCWCLAREALALDAE